MWRSGMNQTASCDGWSWNLSATQVFRQSRFIANRFQERLIPGLCWRIALVQSLGTEIEAHPWQSNGDKTHRQRIIYGETGDGNHKTPFHSIVRTGDLNEHQMEALITGKKRMDFLFNHCAAVCVTADLILFIECCLMCWIAQHPKGSQTHQQK